MMKILLAGVAAVSLAACNQGALEADVVTLDTAIAKDVADVVAFKLAPSPAAAEVLVADGAQLVSDIAQLKADLGSAQAAAKVVAALDQAEQLAAELATPTAIGGDKLLADATALARAAKGAAASA